MKKLKDLYIFLGPPGSGKGSLSQLCVKRLGWQQLSTGNLCREHIALKTPIGQEIDFAIKSGKLISDSLIIDMVNEWLKDSLEAEKPAIFDGFPRTVAQSSALHTLVQSLDRVALKLVQFAIPDDEVVHRLLARSICQNNKCQSVYSLHKHSVLQPLKRMTCNECESPLMCRTDDEESAIQERLRAYYEHEQGMLGFFTKIGLSMSKIPANKPLEDVYATFLNSVVHVGV